MTHFCDTPGCTWEIAPPDKPTCTDCMTDPRIVTLRRKLERQESPDEIFTRQDREVAARATEIQPSPFACRYCDTPFDTYEEAVACCNTDERGEG